MALSDYDDARRRVAAVQRQLDTTVNEIRQDRSLTVAGRRREIAKATLAAKSAAAAVKSDHLTTRKTRHADLEKIAFGSGSDVTPAAADQLSVRDARAKVAAALDLSGANALKGPSIARSLLTQATLDGDEHLARAVAMQARQHGWDDIVANYADKFGKSSALDVLDTIPDGPNTGTADSLVFRIRTPSEVGAFTGDGDLQRLANAEVKN